MDATAAMLLIVEDHHSTRRFLADNLAADGYELLEAESAAEAHRQMQTRFPDLAIVDLELPDLDGLELLQTVRGSDRAAGQLDPDLPLLVLTGRAGELDRLRAFDRGADDYVSKPFSYQELRARIEALLRRTRRRPGMGRLRVGPLELDPLSRQVWLRGEPLDLSKQGVRVTAGAGRGANESLHARGTPARGLGLPGDGTDPNARFARVSPAAQAQPGR